MPCELGESLPLLGLHSVSPSINDRVKPGDIRGFLQLQNSVTALLCSPATDVTPRNILPSPPDFCLILRGHGFLSPKGLFRSALQEGTEVAGIERTELSGLMTQL